MLASLAKFLGAMADGPPVTRISDGFANVPMTNQYGRELRFRDDLVGRRALIVNTMFTVCRGTCPGTSSRLASLRKILSPVFGDDLLIVSISLDPEQDSPRALRRYASIYGADRVRDGLCDWQFLTGKPADVERLRRSLGFYDLDLRVDGDLTRHAAVLYFGNPRKDRWATLPSDLREPLLVEAIRRVAGFTFEQKYGIKG
ncbi:SCO family protein [Isosphaeraceae bacterium EP7]